MFMYIKLKPLAIKYIELSWREGRVIYKILALIPLLICLFFCKWSSLGLSLNLAYNNFLQWNWNATHIVVSPFPTISVSHNTPIGFDSLQVIQDFALTTLILTWHLWCTFIYFIYKVSHRHSCLSSNYPTRCSLHRFMLLSRLVLK